MFQFIFLLPSVTHPGSEQTDYVTEMLIYNDAALAPVMG